MLYWKPSLNLPKRGMEIFVHLIFLISLSESFVTEDVEEVYGFEGESIVINCTYRPEKNQWREKSWCRHISEVDCQHIVSARRFWMPFLKRRNGTTAIADDIQKGILTITINPLQKQDAGLYQCKTAFLGIVNTLQKVKIKVLADKWKTEEFEVVKAEHSISSTKSYADVNLHIFVAGFLCFKLLVAAVIFIIAKNKNMRAERSQENEYQLFPIAANQDRRTVVNRCN